MTAWPVALGAVALPAGRLSDRVPASLLGAAGLAILSFGLVSLAFLTPSATAFDVSWRMAVCGLGFGLFQAPNNCTMLAAAPRERAGAAGGMLATARLLGTTAGATLAALLFHFVPARAEPVELALGAALAIVAAAASLMRGSGRSRSPRVRYRTKSPRAETASLCSLPRERAASYDHHALSGERMRGLSA